MSQISDTDLENLRSGLSDHCKQWRRVLEYAGAIDKVATEQCIGELYGLLEKPKPLILWAESPWQAVAMAAVLQTGIQRRFTPKLSTSTEGSLRSSVELERLYGYLWQQLDLQISGDARARLRADDIANPPKAKDFLKHLRVSEILSTLTSGSFQLPLISHINVASIVIQLVKELNGVGAIRFQNDPGFSTLKNQFEGDFRTLRPENYVNQLRTDLSSTGMAVLVHSSMTDASEDILDVFGVMQLGASIFNVSNNQKSPKEPTRGALCEYGMAITQWAQLSLSSVPSDWLPFYEYVCDRLSSFPVGPTNKKRLTVFVNLLRQTSSLLFKDQVCIISERPTTLKRDDLGRLHSASGPALTYKDGYTLYSWHGVTVPRGVIEDPLTVASILTQMNAEVRRVMIDRYGVSKFIVDSGAQQIHEDEFGVLYRKELFGDEPLVMVKVTNSTPEPDGSRRPYFLRVPPTITTAREAVAWTFDMAPGDYDPKRQT